MNNEEWKDITDPEELFRLKREGWEIESYNSFHICWNEWDGRRWNSTAKFHARPAQPKMKKVKVIGWFDTVTGSTYTRLDGAPVSSDAERYPKLDDEIEVPK